MRNEPNKFREKFGQIIWPTILLLLAIIIILFAVLASSPRFDFPLRD
jgi:branched-subunit amino acid permease